MNFFRLAPVCVLKAGLIITFRSDFENMFMYQHSMKAQDEMRELYRE